MVRKTNERVYKSVLMYVLIHRCTRSQIAPLAKLANSESFSYFNHQTRLGGRLRMGREVHSRRVSRLGRQIKITTEYENES